MTNISYKATVGKIVQGTRTGNRRNTEISVTYTVNCNTYWLHEQVRYEYRTSKLFGIIPVKLCESPFLGDIDVGTRVIVCYDINNPKNAYLRDNNH